MWSWRSCSCHPLLAVAVELVLAILLRHWVWLAEFEDADIDEAWWPSVTGVTA